MHGSFHPPWSVINGAQGGLHQVTSYHKMVRVVWMRKLPHLIMVGPNNELDHWIDCAAILYCEILQAMDERIMIIKWG